MSFGFSGISNYVYKLQVRISGTLNLNCSGNANSIFMGWAIPTSGSTGSTSYSLSGNPFNIALVNIPLVFSTNTGDLQVVNLTFSYISTGPACHSIFVSDISLITYSCDGSCSNCDFTTNACICNTGYYQYQGTCQSPCPTTTPPIYTDPVAMKCVELCPNATYPDASGTCTSCDPACLACSDNTKNCTTCSSYYYRDISTSFCIITCLNTSLGFANNMTCYPCDNSCSGCIYTAYNCISCKTNYFKIIGSNTCVDSCGNGFYNNSLNNCVMCPVGCTLCSIINNALECSKCNQVAGVKYYLSGSECVVNCPSLKFGGANVTNSNNLECMGCT
jgi:hypothetical protein